MSVYRVVKIQLVIYSKAPHLISGKRRMENRGDSLVYHWKGEIPEKNEACFVGQ